MDKLSLDRCWDGRPFRQSVQPPLIGMALSTRPSSPTSMKSGGLSQRQMHQALSFHHSSFQVVPKLCQSFSHCRIMVLPRPPISIRLQAFQLGRNLRLQARCYKPAEDSAFVNACRTWSALVLELQCGVLPSCASFIITMRVSIFGHMNSNVHTDTPCMVCIKRWA